MKVHTGVIFIQKNPSAANKRKKIDVGKSSSSLSPISDKTSATTENETCLLYVELSIVVEGLL